MRTRAEPIGATVDAIRDALSWLGKCQREQAGHSMHLVFRFAPESAPQTALKLKIEINTREHEVLFGYRRYPFEVASDWYSARAESVAFEPEELFGTKLRALLQRRKNRDLFDLHHGLTQLGLDRDKVVTCLNHYLALEDHPIRRAEAEERMLKTLTRSLTEDIEPLLPVGVRFDETVAIDAFNDVWSTLIARLRGDAWRLTADAVVATSTPPTTSSGYPRKRVGHTCTNAKQPTIGVLIDDAMRAIEKDNESLKGVLTKDYARPALNTLMLGGLIDHTTWRLCKMNLAVRGIDSKIFCSTRTSSPRSAAATVRIGLGADPRRPA